MLTFNIFDIFNKTAHPVIPFATNVCVYVVGSSGDKRGYIKGSTGSITPNATWGGIEIYEMTWNVVTGEFIISFGDSGTTYIDNVDNILITHHTVPKGNMATWDESQTAYVFTDLVLAQYIDSNADRACFWIKHEPTQIYSYNFASIQTGNKI